MKKTIMTACAALSFAASAAAVKVATQEWVRKYVGGSTVAVSTNSASGAAKTLSWSVKAEDDPALLECLPRTATLTISAARRTNLVFRATASSVSGVPVGTAWRVMGMFANSANGVIPQMRIRAWVERGSVTNVSWRLCASNVVSGAEYESVRDGGKWILVNSRNPSDRVELAAMRVGDEEARRVYMAEIGRSRLREAVAALFSVLVPSARAEWLDEIPDPLDYEVPDFDLDVETLDTGYLELTVTVKDLDGAPTEYKVRVPQGESEWGEYGKFVLEESVKDFSVVVPPEEFSKSENWGLPWEPDKKGRGSDYDILTFVATIGGEETFIEVNRRSLERSDAWKEFVNAMVSNYAKRRLALLETHECLANPDDGCRCYEYLSVHCPNGRGQSAAQARWGDDAVKGKSVPMHKWIESGKCRVCANGCGEGGHVRDEGKCRCDCGATLASHVRKAGCGCQCGEKDAERDAAWHSRKADGCGCACGLFDPDKTKDARWHPHPLKEGESAGGEEHCECYCKRRDQHLFEDSELCTKICGCCHALTRSGEEATIDDHREMTDARSAKYEVGKIGRCGCECGEMLVTDETVQLTERFHYQKSGSCMCLGADGDGGEWHFPEPDDNCPGVCKYLHSDVRARVAEPDRGHKAVMEVYEADDGDHTAAGDHCGCKCGDYGGTEDDCKSVSKMHVENPDECGCLCKGCSDEVMKDWHKRSEEECGCKCGKTDDLEVTVKQWHRQSDAGDRKCGCKCGKCPPEMADWGEWHVGKPDDCGCWCEEKYQSYDPQWHKPGLSCRCKCALIHPGYDGDRAGTNECSVCSVCHETLAGTPPDAESLHKLNPASGACECWCGWFGEAGDGGKASAERLHLFSGVDENGYTNCVCVCESTHQFRKAKSADLADRKMCEKVCAYCAERTSLGDRAKEEDHTPCASVDQRCGCWCGHVEIGVADLRFKKFHPQKPGTCRCWGAKGSEGGAFHFPCPRADCREVCEHERDGQTHKACNSVEIYSFKPCTESDHEKHATACGCKCGHYSETKGNVPDCMHSFATQSCTCHCQKRHRSNAMKACAKVCGGCGLALDRKSVV